MNITKPKQTRYLAIANDKGGVQKSTIALHLARVYSLAGWSVVLADCDNNQVLMDWAKLAKNAGFDYAFKVCTLMSLSKYAAGADLIIFDTAAQLPDEEKDQLKDMADYILIPTQPTQFAIKATLETAEHFNCVPTGITFTQVEASKKDERKCRAELASKGFNLLATNIRKSKPASRATDAGVTVDAMPSGSRLAWQDYKALAEELAPHFA